MYKKAVQLLVNGMTKEELLQFHEEWDGDELSFFIEFTEAVAKIAPEAFSDPDGIEKADA